jgi:predicted MFS family arabinose efflux permease
MESVATSPAAAHESASYRAYALGLLVVVYVTNFIDRQILTILAGPIAAELRFSDSQLGFLTGPAFALFYTSAGIPIARWADVGVRRSIIAFSLFLWSGMTALSALAQNLTHIALARVGVGLGEAGCSPPAHSLIADLFPPERRASALATYALGIPFGGALGVLVGGWLGQLYGWRTALLAVGLPGVALALLVRLTLREPPRAHAASREGVGGALRFMLRRRAFVHMAAGAAILAFSGYGTGAFYPIFLMRSHGMELGEIGTWLGAIGLLAGGLGTYLGGAVSDRLGQADPRWYLGVPAIASLLSIPSGLAFYLLSDAHAALLLWVPGYVLGSMYLGPTFAMTQSLVRGEMRALAAAVLLFIINAIGLGLGPWLVGALSDALEPRLGLESMRWASLFTSLVATLWAAGHYGLATRTLSEDLRAKDG